MIFIPLYHDSILDRRYWNHHNGQGTPFAKSYTMINRPFLSIFLTAVALVGGIISPGAAQSQSTPTAPASSPFSISPVNRLDLPIQDSAAHAGNLNRAKNLARQTAEKANGGLNLYHAESTMHGPAAESPFIDNGDGTYTFTFLGGKPGFTTPTVQSVVTVNTTGWITHLDYNGIIRN
jgi:hypothetical protein